MFHILSRLLACTASPWLYILILLGFACFTAKRKIRIGCFSVAMMLFLFFSNGYFYNLCLTAYIKPCISEFDSIGHYKYALLPGGFTGYDKIRERTDYGFASGVLCHGRELVAEMDVAVVDSGLPCDGRLDAADT